MKPPTFKTKSLFVGIVVAHFVLGIVLGWFSEDTADPTLLLVFVGVLFAQIGVLSIWCALGPQSWFRRCLISTAAVGYEGLLFGVSFENVGMSFRRIDWEIVMMVPATFGMTILPLLIVRMFGFRLQHGNIDSTIQSLRFSIRQIMIWTFVVACLLVVGKWFHKLNMPAGQFVFLGTICLCFMLAHVLSVWAFLGTANPWFRTVFVVMLALLTGVVISVSWPDDDVAMWILMTETHAFFLLTTLWVLRFLGYRVVR